MSPPPSPGIIFPRKWLGPRLGNDKQINGWHPFAASAFAASASVRIYEQANLKLSRES